MNIGFTHHRHGSFRYLTCPQFDSYNIMHCFTTRLGGVSKGHLSSLNLGLGRGDDKESLEKNFSTVFQAVGFTGENISITGQVHKTNVAVLDKPVLRSENCDAICTGVKNIPIMSYSADCVPVLMYDVGKDVCATVHSGWKGTAAEICAHVLDTMKKTYETRMSDVICAIGPSIGKCCFQIKEDAVSLFKEKYEDLYFIEPEGDKEHFRADLWEAVRTTLLKKGVSDENISLAGECTCCNTDLYFSSRGQQRNFGALGAIIEIRQKN